MNIQGITIESFTITALLATAAICLLAVLVAWYTVRNRIQFSQIILGVFAYVLVIMLENVFNMLQVTAGIPATGITYALFLMLSVVISRELVRFAVIKFGLLDRFHDTDAALGFAIGFAGFYLGVCAAYYYNLYTAANEFVKNGAEAFAINAGEELESAVALLETVNAQTGWQFIFTGVNRAFFLVRELALSVLMWYGLKEEKMRRCLILVPVLHLIAMIPDSLFGAGLMESSYVKDVLTYLLSAGIIAIGAMTYNKKENQVAHFKVEKLRTRKRK